MIWDALALVNGGTLLLGILGALAYGWWFFAIAPPADTSYTPTTEGIPVVVNHRPLPCQVHGCHGRRSHRHLVCPACWKRVPKHLRADVYHSWDQFQAGSPGGFLAWQAARTRCLEAVNEGQTV